VNLFSDRRVLPGRVLWQPYAGLVRLGLKKIEAVRTRTNLRGQLVVCAGRRTDEQLLARLRRELVPAVVSAEAFDEATSLHGAAVALVEIADVRPLVQGDEPVTFWWKPNEPRWAWCLKNVRRLDPAPSVRGMAGFFPISRRSVRRAIRP
jgi:hypothetical protein